jgi:hypothetical protein
MSEIGGTVHQMATVAVRLLLVNGRTRLRSWLTHYATNRKVTDSIPGEVIAFFN